MLDYIYKMPDIYLFVLLSIISVILSIVAVFMVKRYIPLHVRYKDDPVIGNISSVISIIYGILVGLTALYLINNISYTADAVQREANSVSNVYRASKWLTEPTQSKIKVNIQKYLEHVINIEWQEMQEGKRINSEGDTIIYNISDELKLYKPVSNSEIIIMQDLLNSVKSMYDSRQQRIHMSYTALNPDLWIVILIGTILTICINYLFGMNFYMHIFTMTAAALMVSSMIFLLVTLDRPFQGEFVIEPHAFQTLLELINKTK